MAVLVRHLTVQKEDARSLEGHAGELQFDLPRVFFNILKSNPNYEYSLLVINFYLITKVS
jgi:hypothetical protein